MLGRKKTKTDPPPPDRTWDQLTWQERDEIRIAFHGWLKADLQAMLWRQNPNGSWSGRDKNLLRDVFSVPRRPKP